MIFQYENGTGNMGSLAVGQDSDENINARFGMDQRFGVVSVRCHFSAGIGISGIAEMTLNLDSVQGPAYDVQLAIVTGRTGAGVGIGSDVHYRIMGDEEKHWTFEPGDMIVPTWANPSVGNIKWGLAVLLEPRP